MARSAFGMCPSSTSSVGWPLDAEAIQFEDVVGRAHKRPFALHLFESPQQKLSEAARLLDLSDDRFDDSFACRVGRGASLRLQLTSHPVDDRRGLRERASRARPE